MAKAMIAINTVTGVIIASVYFFTESDRSGRTALGLVALLAAALVFPALLSARAERQFASMEVPPPASVRQIVVYPVWAAFVVLLAALFLVRQLSRG